MCVFAHQSGLLMARRCRLSHLFRRVLWVAWVWWSAVLGYGYLMWLLKGCRAYMPFISDMGLLVCNTRWESWDLHGNPNFEEELFRGLPEWGSFLLMDLLGSFFLNHGTASRAPQLAISQGKMLGFHAAGNCRNHGHSQALLSLRFGGTHTGGLHSGNHGGG